jgi:hypothetical protein
MDFYISSNLESSENYRSPNSYIKTFSVATLLKEKSLKDSIEFLKIIFLASIGLTREASIRIMELKLKLRL